MRVGLEFFLGTALVVVLVVVAGRRLRRGGSSNGQRWRYIGLGALLLVLAGALNTLPPHDIVLSILVMVLGIGLFGIGVATLGGGIYTYLAALACGLAAIPWLMTPTSLVLSQVGRPMTCHVRGYTHYGVKSFTADCPDGHSHDMSTGDYRHYPNGQVQLIVDPHNVVPAEFEGPLHVTAKVVASILCLLGAVGIVVAAAINNARRHGRVDPIANPGFSSGP